MYKRQEWNHRYPTDNEGNRIPLYVDVWEEVQEWDGEPEHPFMSGRKLSEEQKAYGRIKESKRWVASQNSGWQAINKHGKVVIPVKGVSKLIMDQINPPKPEMSDAQADAHVRQFV